LINIPQSLVCFSVALGVKKLQKNIEKKHHVCPVT